MKQKSTHTHTGAKVGHNHYFTLRVMSVLSLAAYGEAAGKTKTKKK